MANARRPSEGGKPPRKKPGGSSKRTVPAAGKPQKAEVERKLAAARSAAISKSQRRTVAGRLATVQGAIADRLAAIERARSDKTRARLIGEIEELQGAEAALLARLRREANPLATLADYLAAESWSQDDGPPETWDFEIEGALNLVELSGGFERARDDDDLVRGLHRVAGGRSIHVSVRFTRVVANDAGRSEWRSASTAARIDRALGQASRALAKWHRAGYRTEYQVEGVLITVF